MKRLAVLLLLLAAVPARAQGPSAPTAAELAAAISGFTGKGVGADAVEEILCNGFEEEPTEFYCSWRQRTRGNWREWSSYLAISGEGWSLIDQPAPTGLVEFFLDDGGRLPEPFQSIEEDLSLCFDGLGEWPDPVLAQQCLLDGVEAADRMVAPGAGQAAWDEFTPEYWEWMDRESSQGEDSVAGRMVATYALYEFALVRALVLAGHAGDFADVPPLGEFVSEYYLDPAGHAALIGRWRALREADCARSALTDCRVLLDRAASVAGL